MCVVVGSVCSQTTMSTEADSLLQGQVGTPDGDTTTGEQEILQVKCNFSLYLHQVHLSVVCVCMYVWHRMHECMYVWHRMHECTYVWHRMHECMYVCALVADRELNHYPLFSMPSNEFANFFG